MHRVAASKDAPVTTNQSKTSIRERDIVMLVHEGPITLKQVSALHASPQIWV